MHTHTHIVYRASLSICIHVCIYIYAHTHIAYIYTHIYIGASHVAQWSSPVANIGDAGWSPEPGRSPGLGNGNPPQYSCLENPRDRGACRAAVCGVTQSRTRLKWLSSSSTSPMQWTWTWANLADGEGQGGLACVWSQRVRHHWATRQQHTHTVQGAELNIL